MHHVAITQDVESVRMLNETLSRCRVLFLEEWATVRTRERTNWIGAGIRPLHVTSPPAREEMSALLALSFVGWCWRAAERGKPERLRAALLRARAAVENDASVPKGLVPAWTAWRFLNDGGQPGLGSPGTTKRSRVAFLDAAFDKIHETYGMPAGIDPDRSRAAFNHGVALNDVERLIVSAQG